MNSSRLSSATFLPALIFLTHFESGFGAEASAVMGSISLDQNGVAQITECTTNRLLPIGPMTPSANDKLVQSYAEISENGKFAVVVEVKGVPFVGSLRRGACGSTPRKIAEVVAFTRMLQELKGRLDHHRSTRGLEMPTSEQSDLAFLVGATKQQLQTTLGEPDYCNVRRDSKDDCPNSDRWMYSFKSSEPIIFGGCCGLELQFNELSRVTFVKWQGYR